jgi:hypothetical protein
LEQWFREGYHKIIVLHEYTLEHFQNHFSTVVSMLERNSIVLTPPPLSPLPRLSPEGDSTQKIIGFWGFSTCSETHHFLAWLKNHPSHYLFASSARFLVPFTYPSAAVWKKDETIFPCNSFQFRRTLHPPTPVFDPELYWNLYSDLRENFPNFEQSRQQLTQHFTHHGIHEQRLGWIPIPFDEYYYWNTYAEELLQVSPPLPQQRIPLFCHYWNVGRFQSKKPCP